MFSFQKLLGYFSNKKEKEAKEKLQGEFGEICFSGDIEALIEYLDLGASFAYKDDPAFLLKDLLELPNSERYLDTIFKHMPLTPEFLDYPKTDMASKHNAPQPESIFQFVLNHYFLSTAQAFIDNSHSESLLAILEKQAKELLLSGREVERYQAALELIEKKKLIFHEKELLEKIVGKNSSIDSFAFSDIKEQQNDSFSTASTLNAAPKRSNKLKI